MSADMTQEREAMEAVLERYGRVDKGKGGQAVYNVHPCEVLQKMQEDETAIIDFALSRHARALQPITVEGLVEMGFEKSTDWIGTHTYPSILGLKRSGCEFYYGKEKVFPRPLTLGDLDWLIERLSR